MIPPAMDWLQKPDTTGMWVVPQMPLGGCSEMLYVMVSGTVVAPQSTCIVMLTLCAYTTHCGARANDQKLKCVGLVWSWTVMAQ